MQDVGPSNSGVKEMFNFKMVFVFLLINASQVSAITITGDTTGFFTIKNESIVTLADAIVWGTGRGRADPQSSLSYEGFSFNDGTQATPFKIGSLTYGNTRIFGETSFATYVADNRLGDNFDLTVDFSSGQDDIVFNYGLSIVETDNDLTDSADRVTITAVGNSNPLFLLEGGEFSFELLGFKKGPEEFDNFFIQQEGSSSSVDLYAKVSAVSAVPIPSAIWLFITALSGFFISRKRSVG